MHEFKGLCLLWAAATSGHISSFHCYANGLRYMNNKPKPNRPLLLLLLWLSSSGPSQLTRIPDKEQAHHGSANSGVMQIYRKRKLKQKQKQKQLSASWAFFTSSRKCLKRHCATARVAISCLGLTLLRCVCVCVSSEIKSCKICEILQHCFIVALAACCGSRVGKIHKSCCAAIISTLNQVVCNHNLTQFDV